MMTFVEQPFIQHSKGRGTNNPAGRPGNERDIPAAMFFLEGPGGRQWSVSVPLTQSRVNCLLWRLRMSLQVVSLA